MTRSIIAIELLLNCCIYHALCCGTPNTAILRTWITTEDEEPLFTTVIQCHECKHTCLFLNPAKLAPAIAHDPSFAIAWYKHFGAIITSCNIAHSHSALQLLEQPSQVISAALALFAVTCDVSESADIEQNAPCSLLDLCLCGGLLSNDIAQGILADSHAVSVKTIIVGFLLAKILSEDTWLFLFNLVHALQFSTTTASLISKNNELLTPTTTATFISIFIHEEHQRAVPVLHR